MSEDALVNTGAVAWPHPDVAWLTVRSMQDKLHRWAGEDDSRRFGDLYNLVYDPAFLMHAWAGHLQDQRFIRWPAPRLDR